MKPNTVSNHPPTDPSRSIGEASDASLIGQTKRGTDAAFAELIRRHQRVVRAVLGRYLRDDNEVDEVAQRTFVEAYRSLERFRGDSKFASWLVAIARGQAANYLRDQYRRRKHETTACELALLSWTNESLDSGDDVERRTRMLDACLQLLPSHSRDVVDRHYFQRQPIETIAQGHGRSRGAVRMLLMRIRKALASCISQRLAEAEFRS